jgi:hypothetical protein
LALIVNFFSILDTVREDNIKMEFQEVGCEGMDWIDVVQDRDVAGSCEYGNEPPGSKKCGEFLV